MNESALVTRSLFPTPPGQETLAAFRRHIAETAQPETFPQISTACPPAEGTLKALVTDVDLNRQLRPDKDLAPCPICSDGKPKFLQGGTLIWCEASSAIYFIGGECSEKLFGAGRLDQAINLLKESERVRFEKDALAIEVAAVPARRAWIAQHMAHAAEADAVHKEMARMMPLLRGALSRQLKGAIGGPRIEGAGMLRATWKLAAKLREVDDALKALATAAGQDPEAWAESMAPTAVSQRLGGARRALTTLTTVRDSLQEATAFFTETNMRALGQWGASGQAPMNFRMQYTLAGVEFRTDGEHWRGKRFTAAPAAIPA